MFNDSIIYNLTYANPEASQEEVERACAMVNIHEMISALPDGYHSQVGELGSKLSGGERQRIAIARSLLKEANIYIFDEATSAIDSQNEKLFMDIVDNVLKGKTRIFAAHRLSTITGCDNIIVLGESGVVEQGTHLELI
jgi:ABC-type multidrug transport system fused ATPase/permease subunit